jgi:DNA-binding MarR family transcriptional regulator
MQKEKIKEMGNPLSEDFKQAADQIREVNFWLCVTFSDTIGRYCEITMKKDDISPLHAIAMYHLVCAGGVSTPTQLADMMFRSKHSVTKIVDNLEREGFIVRDFSSKDRRVTQIKVTPAGLKYVKQNQNKADVRAKQVMDCLDLGEQKQLVACMDKLGQRMTNILEKL